MAVEAREQQGRLAINVTRIDVRPMAEEAGNNLSVAVLARQLQGQSAFAAALASAPWANRRSAMSR